MSDKRRNRVLDWGSTLLNGITGGKKADVAEGVEGKTRRLYDTYGTNSKQEKEGYAEKMAPTVRPDDDSSEARRRRAQTRQSARDSGFI